MNKIFAVVIALAAGTVFAKSNPCPTGMLFNANEFCEGATCNVETDGYTCCEEDPTKCGAKNVNCGPEHFQDGAKDGNTAGADTAAMKANCCTTRASRDKTCAIQMLTRYCDTGFFKDAKKAGETAGNDAAAMKTICCTAKAACSTDKGLCTNGWKAKTGAQFCAEAECKFGIDAPTREVFVGWRFPRDVVECCELDTTTCLGTNVNFECDSGFFRDAKKAGTTAGKDAAAMKTNCCTAKAACSTDKGKGLCTNGRKAKTGAKLCAGAECKSTDAGTCCEWDSTTCGFQDDIAALCATGFFEDPEKAGATAGKDSAAMRINCCTAQATCETFSAVTASSVKAQTPAMAFIFAMVGVLALLK